MAGSPWVGAAAIAATALSIAAKAPDAVAACIGLAGGISLATSI
jgi:hypothetical protein